MIDVICPWYAVTPTSSKTEAVLRKVARSRKVPSGYFKVGGGTGSPPNSSIVLVMAATCADSCAPIARMRTRSPRHSTTFDAFLIEILLEELERQSVVKDRQIVRLQTRGIDIVLRV